MWSCATTNMCIITGNPIVGLLFGREGRLSKATFVQVTNAPYQHNNLSKSRPTISILLVPNTTLNFSIGAF